jgi:hypothetical protein
MLSLLLALLQLSPLLPQIPQPPSGQIQLPASIDGVVFDSETRQPLPGATVTVQDRGPAAGKRVLVTGNDGRFVFRNLPPSPYTIEASRSGYISAAAGSRAETPNRPPTVLAPTETPMIQQLTSGQVLSGLQLVLTPGGAISGRLTDDRGEPVVGVVVQAFRTTHKNGLRERTLVQAVVSNDLGEYRLFMLRPGQYHIAMLPPAIAIPNMPSQPFSIPLFYPGTIDAKEAQVLDLRVGQSVEGVDFPAIPTRNRRIAGGVQGNATNGVRVTLSPANGTAQLTRTIASDNPNPDFQFLDVVPGTYSLIAQSVDQRAAISLDVRNSDILGTRIILGPGIQIPSRARIEGRPPGNDPDLENIYFVIRPDVPVSGLEADTYTAFAGGRFTLEVLNRDYWIEITRTQDYYIKSITLGSVDILNQGLRASRPLEGTGPLEIVFDNRFGVVQGYAAAPNVTVVLAPDTARRNQRQLFKSTKSSNGVFVFEKVPPGDYKLFAWSEDTVDNGGPWLDPEYLSRFEGRATPVRIQGDTRTMVDRPIAVF